jgi:protoheme IX farnesyltransferase
MLPVVAPAPVVVRKILIYSYAMVAASLALIPYAGWIYAAGTVGLGAWFLAEAHRLRSRVVAATSAGSASRPGVNPAAMRLFHLSIAYLSLLFALTAVGSLVPWGRW